VLSGNVTLYGTDIAMSSTDSNTKLTDYITNLNTAVNARVLKTQKINGKALSGDITLTAWDIATSPTDSTSVNTVTNNLNSTKVNKTQKINSKELTGDETLYSWDINLSNTDSPTISQAITALNNNKVDKTQKINSKALSGDITLTGSDIAISSSNPTKLDMAITTIDVCPPVTFSTDVSSPALFIPVTFVNFPYSGVAVLCGTFILTPASATANNQSNCLACAQCIVSWDPKSVDTGRASMMNFPQMSSNTPAFRWLCRKVSDSNYQLYLNISGPTAFANTTWYIQFMGTIANCSFGTPATGLTFYNTGTIINGRYSYASI
jgi:hypothetical protein